MENEDKVASRILAIDCAVGSGSVAVLSGGTVLASSADIEGSPARAEEVLQVIKAVLLSADTRQSDLDIIAVSVGPGSYSGIRIGLATAAGLAGALSVPYFGVSVLDAMSLSLVTDGRFVTAVGVGKRHIGWSSFELRGADKRRLSANIMQCDEDFGRTIGSLGDVTLLCDRSLSSRVEAVVSEPVAVSEIQETVAGLVGVYACRHPAETSLGPLYLRDEATQSGQPVT